MFFFNNRNKRNSITFCKHFFFSTYKKAGWEIKKLIVDTECMRTECTTQRGWSEEEGGDRWEWNVDDAARPVARRLVVM